MTCNDLQWVVMTGNELQWLVINWNELQWLVYSCMGSDFSIQPGWKPLLFLQQFLQDPSKIKLNKSRQNNFLKKYIRYKRYIWYYIIELIYIYIIWCINQGSPCSIYRWWGNQQPSPTQLWILSTLRRVPFPWPKYVVQACRCQYLPQRLRPWRESRETWSDIGIKRIFKETNHLATAEDRGLFVLITLSTRH